MRITCDKCKKRRKPWWEYGKGSCIEKYYEGKFVSIKVHICGAYICYKCNKEIFEKIDKGITDEI